MESWSKDSNRINVYTIYCCVLEITISFSNARHDDSNSPRRRGSRYLQNDNDSHQCANI